MYFMPRSAVVAAMRALKARIGAESVKSGEMRARVKSENCFFGSFRWLATQVAIFRRVQRYKLSLRGRQQEEEGRRAGLASNTSTPMIWGWSVDAL